DILQRGAVVRDMVSTSAGGAGGTVKLPNEKAGLMMVFRAFDRVSFALVLKATRAIHLQDIVKSP
ncbi:MAG: LysM domain-containing protein, partial [Gammaproteobacteria bacterium]